MDFPISDDVDRDEIFGNITSSLSSKRYLGDLSIWAYTEENTPNCYGAGIIFGQGDISCLTNKMIMDMLFWAMNTREPSNLIVIAKDITEESELISVLGFLKSKNFNVILVDEVEPDVLPGIVSSVWPFRSLLLDG